MLLGEQGTRPRIQQRVFVRGVTHSNAAGESMEASEAAMVKALDELELAQLDKAVTPTSSSHLFLHILEPISGEPADIIAKYDEVMGAMIAKCAQVSRRRRSSFVVVVVVVRRRRPSSSAAARPPPSVWQVRHAAAQAAR